MTRERLIPLALVTSALLIAASCTTDGSSSDPTVSSGGDDITTTEPPDTSTVPTPTSDPTTSLPGPGPQGFASANLEFFGDCAALLSYRPAEASERVTAWGLGGGGFYYGDGRVVFEEDLAATDDAGAAEVAPDAAPAPGAIEGQDFSGTNTQEVGVDEGDIVETDGDYVYVANTDGLRIVSVADAIVVAEPELPQGSHQLLLDEDRLVVVTSSWGGAPDTIVSLLDVADPTNPSLLRRTHLEGAVVATRSIDGVARLVITTSFDQRLPFVQPNQFGLDEDSALERNKEIIAESTVEDWLPRWFDEDADGGFGPMSQVLPCETVAAPPDFAGLGLTWIGSIDVNGDGTPIGSAGIVSTGDTVYASTDNLYVATQNWDWRWGGPVPLVEEGASETAPEEDPGPPPTLIHQFRLDDGTAATYVASGKVDGRLLNQFAMSEYNGDLRVATTTDDWGGFGDQSESTVFVLRPEGDQLREISSVGGLGKDEQIYAVRFLGDLAYVVTFRQIDPLYVIDLSDPANPVEAGELKIPGYSAYLHPVGDGLLLGVGQDATDTGRTTGTQLSLFDVSNPSDPQRISTLPIGGYSEVEWDHKAFLFWPEDGTIVLPVSPGWGDCGPNDDCLAKGLVGPGGGAVVAELNGRELAARGTISHSSPNRSGCWNPLQRSIAIGDELVTVGLDQMKFSDRQSLESRDSVSWGDPEQYGCYWYYD
jgi:hypothetical protein